MGRLLRICAAAALAGLTLSGCALTWYSLKNPGTNQSICVNSGDRYYFTLDEDSDNGYRWQAKSDDDDVEVVLDHEEPDVRGEKGRVKVRIRIFRGFDGPSAVTFRCRGARTRETTDSFVLTFYRRTYDTASWE